tara:strand:+ start:563 stop:1237 length:675 start_codon:yes stop_codon:yes gene_type:complete
VDLFQLQTFVDRLRLETIGEPHYNANHKVFEYADHSPIVVVILKLLRAVHGLYAMESLRASGLFIDFGATIRMVNDCVEEVYFILEAYPKAPSTNVTQFVNGFFEHSIDNYLDATTEPVARNKIRNAVVRVLHNGNQDEATRVRVEHIYKTFCGYIHANYVHIMEVYGGSLPSFNLSGVPSLNQREIRKEHVKLAIDAVALATAFAASKLQREALNVEITTAID